MQPKKIPSPRTSNTEQLLDASSSFASAQPLSPELRSSEKDSKMMGQKASLSSPLTVRNTETPNTMQITLPQHGNALQPTLPPSSSTFVTAPQTTAMPITHCHCGIAAALRVVRKNNENKGREFYGCSFGKCDFFTWAASPSSNCYCGLPAKELTVTKDGPTKGRAFSKCATNRCNFFKWCTASAPSQRSSPY